MEYNINNRELWFNQDGEEEEDELVQTPDSDATQSPQAELPVSTDTPTMGDSEELDTGISSTTFDSSAPTMTKATSTGGFLGLGNIFNLNTNINEGGRDYQRYPQYGLPPENNPDSPMFDPTAEGSKDSLGRTRWGSADWDRYNANRSSGENLQRGVKLGGLGGGFGSGSSTTVVTPSSNSGKGSGRKNMLPLIGGALILGTIVYFSFIKK
jgi:hypothetical protein